MVRYGLRLGKSQARGSFRNPILLQKIRPGQIPVIPAKVKNAKGRYRTQLTLSNPVSPIPSRITPATDRNNIRSALMDCSPFSVGRCCVSTTPEHYCVSRHMVSERREGEKA